jgi:DNA-binding MarR family transcriptional regulator
MSKQGNRGGHDATSEAVYRAVDQFTFEVALLFFRMQVAATQYLGQGRHSTGRRSILKNLAAGPQTVPAMARRRAVSRQHIQKLVDTLRADGLVSSQPDPADRRTRVLKLTARGRAFLDELRKREVRLFAELAAGIPIEELERATQLVQEVRGRLEGEGWERRLQQGRPSGGSASRAE